MKLVKAKNNELIVQRQGMWKKVNFYSTFGENISNMRKNGRIQSINADFLKYNLYNHSLFF